IVDNSVLTPAHQPKRGRAINEAVFLCAFPNEMPGIVGINAHGAATAAGGNPELAPLHPFEGALAVSYRVSIVAFGSRHEPDAEQAAVARITKTSDRKFVRA